MDIFQENQHAQAQLDDGLNVAKKNNEKIVKKVGQHVARICFTKTYSVRTVVKIDDVIQSTGRIYIKKVDS